MSMLHSLFMNQATEYGAAFDISNDSSDSKSCI
jgi:hypothetical protein